MRLIHPDNIPKVIRDEKFNKLLAELHPIVKPLLKMGFIGEVLKVEEESVDNPIKNIINLRQTILNLLDIPNVHEVVKAEDGVYIRSLFLTIFAEESEPDPRGEPTVQMRTHRKHNKPL